MSEPNYDDLYFAAGDQSDGAVVTNTDRTQQTIELINKIERLQKELVEVVKLLILCDGKIDGYYSYTTSEIRNYLENAGFIIARDEYGEIIKPKKIWIKELVDRN